MPVPSFRWTCFYGTVQVDIPVTLFDERMTSVEARGILKDDGLGKCFGYQRCVP